jgi:hypothetical protein
LAFLRIYGMSWRLWAAGNMGNAVLPVKSLAP